jgi:2-polyprenyl-3-methyl-5-hydroxy-6-metoxy-1,4-benzoquinol methylase
MSVTGWDNFWKGQRKSFYAVMRIATGYFVSQLEKLYHFKPTDTIFDYGCGPGFVADALASKNIRTTGADINEFFIEECRQHHPASLFVLITTDPAANKKILEEQLQGRQFDCIILLSVAQYLKTTNDLEDIVKLLRFYIKEQGRLIIADVLDDDTSAIRDAFALFMHCIKKGRIGTFIGFMSYLIFSNYRKLTNEISLLRVPEQAISDMAKRNALQYEKKKGLTIHVSRYSYILTHRP